MNLYSKARVLENDIAFLSGAKGDSESSQLRLRAAVSIKTHLVAAARELSLERYEYFEKDLYQRLFNLILGEENSINDKVGGIMALRELINTASASTEDKILKISETLSEALRTNSDYALLELITDALGNFFAKAALVSQLDCIERQLHTALEWLKSPLPHRKFVACSMLRHLAEKSPTVFFARLREFFDSIFFDLWDPKERIRVVASSAITACLAVLADRTYHLEWYYLIYNKLHEGLSNSTSSETCHGSLILMSSLLAHTGDFMIPRYRETCRAALLLRDNRSNKVKSALLQLLPQLSNYCPDIFAASYLDDALDLLVKCSKVTELRAESLITTGKICIALGPIIIGKSDIMLEIAREALTTGSWQYRRGIAPEAVLCIADMVLGICGAHFHSSTGRAEITNAHVLQSLKMRNASSINDDLVESTTYVVLPEQYAEFQNKILDLVESMIQSGLSKELVNALIVVADYLPEQKIAIKQRLVDEAIKILGGNTTTSRTPTSSDYSYSWSKQGVRFGSKYSMNYLEGSHLSNVSKRVDESLMNSGQGNGNSHNYDDKINKSNGNANISEASANAPPSTAISRFPFFHFFTRAASSSSAKDGANSSVHIESAVSKSPELVILALKILSSLAPPASKLIPLLLHSVIPYISSDDREVRKEAVATCALTLCSSGALRITTGPSSRAIENIITRLVEVLISDHVLDIRLSLIRCMSAQFDICLSRQHHVDSLAYLLADESFEMRVETLAMLSRLAVINPANVLPHVRFLLARLISELRSTFDNKVKEETILVICNIMRAMPLYPVIRAYLKPIITSLPFGVDTSLSVASLEAFGEVCLVMKRDCVEHVKNYLPVVINYIRDSSSKLKQGTALKTIGQMISASGLVIEPYLIFPQLFPFILDLIVKTSDENSWPIRREAMRTLGIIGAIEPRRFDKIVSQLVIYVNRKNKLELQGRGEKAENMYNLQQINRGSASSTLRVGNHPYYDFSARSFVNNNSSLRWKEASDALSSQSGDKDREKDAASDASLISSDTLLAEENGNVPSYLFMYEQSVMCSLASPSSTEPQRLLPTSENYYPHVTISSLLKILKDESISHHHSSAASTIVSVLRSLDSKGFIYLDEIVPLLLKMLPRSSSGIQESLLQSISAIISIAQTNVLPYISQIFDVIVYFWNDHLGHIMNLAQDIARVLPLSFEECIPQLLPLLLSSLSLPSSLSPSMIKLQKNNVKLQPIEESLKCCNSLKLVLRPFNHIIVPVLCKVISQLAFLGFEFQKCLILAIRTLRNITTSSNGSTVQHVSSVVIQLVHTLTSVVSLYLNEGVSSQCPVYQECLITLCSIGRQIGVKFLTFDACIMKAIDGKGLNISYYSQFVEKIRIGAVSAYSLLDDVLEEEVDFGPDLLSNGVAGKLSFDTLKVGTVNNPNQRYVVNQQQLARTWDVSQRTTASDWQEWMRQIKIDFVRESPSPVIRSCVLLSQSYLPLAHDLFHAAFMSCWLELSDIYQTSLVHALETAFKSLVVPPEIMQTLLNLAEFMEHDVEAFPISMSILADLAQKSRAYAKALHYRELEFSKTPETCFESLITINKKLDRNDAAIGILKCVQSKQKNNPALQEALKAEEAWLEKLGYWDEALLKYESRLSVNNSDIVAISGKLKCLDALGRWEEAVKICNESLGMYSNEGSHSPVNSSNTNNLNALFNKPSNDAFVVSSAKSVVLGARAAWSLNQWSQMDEFVEKIPDSSVEGSLMRAVLAVNNENFSLASDWIENTRRQLDKSISTLLSESYSRAYDPLITAQQCSELEEIIEYKKLCAQNTLLQKPFASNHKPYSRGNFANVPRHCCDLLPLRALASQETPDVSGKQLANSDLKNATLSMEYMNNLVGSHKVDLASKWMLRLRGSCGTSSQAAVFLWKNLINGHSIILNGCEDIQARLEFASLCRKNKNLALAEQIVRDCEIGLKMNTSISAKETALMNMNITYANLKLKWANGKRLEALEDLESLIKSVSAINDADQANFTSDVAIHVKCLLKLGQWKLAMVGPGMAVEKTTRREVISIYQRATQVSNNNYRAWHMWGLANYRAIEEIKESKLAKQGSQSAKVVATNSFDALLPLIVNTTKGLMKAISLGIRRSASSITQDLLTVLSIWFRYGHYSPVKSALEEGLAIIHVDNWLGVIPQLIARIDHPEIISRTLLHNLIVKLALLHPQALVFPLSVAITTPKAGRKAAAEHVLSSLQNHCPVLADQAVTVSRELIRVAIVWEELWHESLEEASKLYYQDGNVNGMMEILTGLHIALDNATTTYEVGFKNTLGKDLKFAWDSILEAKAIMTQERYVQPVPPVPPTRKADEDMTPLERCLNRAWKYYFITFQSINKRLSSIQSLELSSCSPLLFELHDLDLGVPGTYHVSGQAIQIKSFSPTVTIIKSKQRPRKIKILGENGMTFNFLLKGHEDLRQDERVMQLFGLVNALLAYDRNTVVDIDALSIERYAVIPLSPTVGLISWVPNCDTMHDLVREYRDSKRIILNVEHKLMQSMVTGSQAYDILTYIQKMDVFEYGLEHTPGDDLARILWLKSTTSESWLQRRSNYTRSIAVMSMVGYILGLGDRHPSNLMFLRDSGKVLHIDFGDCFEVAMHREKYPEKIPFRLTRMLVNAMEISGIEGNFRLTCEKVMAVLRENSDSLVAILEAFVYDPLISWRLFNNPVPNNIKAKKDSELGDNKKEEGSTPSTAITSVQEAQIAPKETTDEDEESSLNAKSKNNRNNTYAKSGSGVISSGINTITSVAIGTRLETVLEDEENDDDEESDITGTDSSTNKNVMSATSKSGVISDSIPHINIDKGGEPMGSDLLKQMRTMSDNLSYREESASFSFRHMHGSSSSKSLTIYSSLQLSNLSNIMSATDEMGNKPEMSEKAISVIRRVTDKLIGLDFNGGQGSQPVPSQALEVADQVDRLIIQATAIENLCHLYIGWCSFW